MKICFKCGESKQLDSFYKHPKMTDGHLGKCKECTKSDTKKDYDRKIIDPQWKQSENQRTRLKYHRLNYKEKYPTNHTEDERIKWKEKYPEKYRVKCLCNNIKREQGCENHHWSYKEENAFDIIKLPYQEHQFYHTLLIYEQSEKCFKTKDGVLLDTKEKHNLYLKELKPIYDEEIKLRNS